MPCFPPGASHVLWSKWTLGAWPLELSTFLSCSEFPDIQRPVFRATSIPQPIYTASLRITAERGLCHPRGQTVPISQHQLLLDKKANGSGETACRLVRPPSTSFLSHLWPVCHTDNLSTIALPCVCVCAHIRACKYTCVAHMSAYVCVFSLWWVRQTKANSFSSFPPRITGVQSRCDLAYSDMGNCGSCSQILGRNPCQRSRPWDLTSTNGVPWFKLELVLKIQDTLWREEHCTWN